MTFSLGVQNNYYIKNQMCLIYRVQCFKLTIIHARSHPYITAGFIRSLTRLEI